MTGTTSSIAVRIAELRTNEKMKIESEKIFIRKFIGLFHKIEGHVSILQFLCSNEVWPRYTELGGVQKLVEMGEEKGHLCRTPEDFDFVVLQLMQLFHFSS